MESKQPEPAFHPIFSSEMGNPRSSSVQEAIKADLMHKTVPESTTQCFDAFVIFVRRLCSTISIKEMQTSAKTAVCSTNPVLRYALQHSSKVTRELADLQLPVILSEISQNDLKSVTALLSPDGFMRDFWAWPELEILIEDSIRLPSTSQEWRPCKMSDLEPWSEDAIKGHYLVVDRSGDAVDGLKDIQDVVLNQLGPHYEPDGSQHLRRPTENANLCVLYRGSPREIWPRSQLQTFWLPEIIVLDDTGELAVRPKSMYTLTAVLHELGFIRTYTDRGKPLNIKGSNQVTTWSLGSPGTNEFLLLYQLCPYGPLPNRTYFEHPKPPCVNPHADRIIPLVPGRTFLHELVYGIRKLPEGLRFRGPPLPKLPGEEKTESNKEKRPLHVLRREQMRNLSGAERESLLDKLDQMNLAATNKQQHGNTHDQSRVDGPSHQDTELQ